jgi:hypothetical protein
MTKKVVTKAIDADQHIAEYCTWDDEKVWVAKDGKAICYADGVGHLTTKEWYEGQ